VDPAGQSKRLFFWHALAWMFYPTTEYAGFLHGGKMPAEIPAPKKSPKTVRRRSVPVNELIRIAEESRILTAEVAQLICELQQALAELRETRQARVLKFPAAQS
jgi:hypothetical protein